MRFNLIEININIYRRKASYAADSGKISIYRGKVAVRSASRVD